MLKKNGSYLAAILTALFLFAPMLTARAHHAVLHFNLEEMTATADRIFIGKCIAVKETEEALAKGILPVTNYTFAVSQTLKGRVPSVFTYKQLGHAGKTLPLKNSKIPAVKRAGDSTKVYLHGMTDINIGDEMLLMLIPQYMEGRLTYPVGLYQGAFYITRAESGKLFVNNSVNNRGLFTNSYNNYTKSAKDARVVFPEADRNIVSAKIAEKNIGTLTAKPGALPLEDFVGLVREIVELEKK